ncbi:hypothetical protein [Facklamia miroungae]|uniref:Uncharacterized protein n=1 Tax=Facklamia miroungae TaxID=120956 RepID=A0A1G7QKX9_9LACT|nr:hypothetical protein [Facklamia miroungae]NKZ28961.1 hypothetical protein [Facklamia miroungae]SDF98559.1 hypothetical protein SAMN05421791_102110 [Facklamia miroungae]
MIPLNVYVQRLDKNFWIYNFFASFSYFAINGFDDIRNFILFPIAIMLVIYILKERLQTTADTQYLGFYPLSKDFGKLIIAAIMNYVIWHFSGVLFLIALVYVMWKEYH